MAYIGDSVLNQIQWLIIFGFHSCKEKISRRCGSCSNKRKRFDLGMDWKMNLWKNGDKEEHEWITKK